jgi:hypothetical protein
LKIAREGARCIAQLVGRTRLPDPDSQVRPTGVEARAINRKSRLARRTINGHKIDDCH